MARVIDGKGIAQSIRLGLKDRVAEFIKRTGVKPKLTVILIGEDPASQIYVRNKERGCQEIGIGSEVKRLPSTTTEAELIGIIEGLNKERSVHGILVQLPLPKGLSEITAINAIEPSKDVDGLHPTNMGRLLKGEEGVFVPCTAQGVIELILSTGIEIRGKEVVVIGRSNIVGKPTAILLLQRHATVTICHSRTADLPGTIGRADILVAAVGRPEIVKGGMIKKGAVVIDVGTTRVGEKLKGDVEFEAAQERAGYITPVPGGVGPMTIAMLLKNTLQAAELLTAA